MASRYVVCKDREEALTMLDAGLLLLNWGVGGNKCIGLAMPDRRWIVERYDELSDSDNNVWITDDFMYLVEED